jgi:acyl transferase domain-containing protein/acyl-CoA synthetase (AMP-forming)/AMP-acid ligase II/NADPH:quinone reductase-like Zn-dependent oxidoreductase/NAD(P)-dependent dehydrogenase (short-subunit alcohol dehydrogenase family)/acyl carrier protein
MIDRANNTSDVATGAAFEPATLVELLSWRALCQPHRVAYTFLVDGEREEVSLTYRELDEQARIIAAFIQANGGAGSHVLLLYPQGLEYIAAFFGCLYAGAVAIPTYPPRPNRSPDRLNTIIADAEVTLALTTSAVRQKLNVSIAVEPLLSSLRLVATDELPQSLLSVWRAPSLSGESLAFLQYTSGSTASPKGVMVSHGNLLFNHRMLQSGVEHPAAATYVSWCPLFHDLGLIGNALQSLYTGDRCVIMSPAAFLQKPFRWLDAISRYKATSSGGPNFAYDLCARKITPEQRATLDLSSWTLAVNAAEPVRGETLRRFAETFAECGFRPEAFYPCYGLAEATLIVSGGGKAAPPVLGRFEREALEQHRAVPVACETEDASTLVGCGHSLLDERVVIVDPETLDECAPQQVGEIWVAGRNVAQGYWKKEEETERTFRAYLAQSNEGPFLRTGDLGFVSKGELFVTGRLKDLIIIRGHNHYPQDIELTVEQSHEALHATGGAAFALDVEGAERLCIVHELTRQGRHADTREIVEAIRRAVVEQHELEVYAVALVKPGMIPKTSSGKIQRTECRRRYLSQSLEPVCEWTLSDAQSGSPNTDAGVRPCETPEARASETPDAITADVAVEAHYAQNAVTIQAWLIAQLANALKLRAEDIDVREPFQRYGLDSVAAVSLTGDLETWLGRRVSPTLIYEYPSIESLALHLSNESPVALSSTPMQEGAARAGVDEPIAIIGIGCRFPGAHDPQSFWQLLKDGVDAITEIPHTRWDHNLFYDPQPSVPGKTNSRWGGFLDGIDGFDRQFFGLSAMEAARMDPQQRLLLEVAWEALEDAGQRLDRLAGTRAGVFIGISGNEYGRLQMSDATLIDAYAATGNALSIAANRISYLFDLRGPSLAIDTACSSSLVAIHVACQSLRSGESTLAVAGGVNLILSPALAIGFTRAGVTSPDGHCKTFDASANGYVRSEGAGVVILKPLSQALADRNPIYALIRSTAVNQDGRTNGMMAPSPQSQEELLREAYRRAGVSPGDVQYVEAHGTGTLLGDPIEAKALGAVLATGRAHGSPCAIGSVKSNIGHLEAAAGVAGVIKVALALKHRTIPASLHFQKPNPYIPFDTLPLRVQQAASAWPETGRTPIAGVSSFGFGGTNAHAVLTGAPEGATRQTSTLQASTLQTPVQTFVQTSTASGAQLFPLSARSPEALRALAQTFKELSLARSCDAATGGSAQQPDVTACDESLEALAYSMSLHRTHHDHRLAVTASSYEELAAGLDSFCEGVKLPGVAHGERQAADVQTKLAFVFSGHGSQWIGMGRTLLTKEAVFRAAIERCDASLSPHTNWSVLEQLNAPVDRSRLDEFDVIQICVFAIQVALAELWRSWGITPDAVVGHSMGEVAAAHVAGALSLEDAARVICERSRLLKRLSGQGGMAAVELAFAETQRALAGYEDEVSIAASNGPTSTVLSGAPASLAEVVKTLEGRGVFCSLVKCEVAGHSPQTASLLGELEQALAGLQPRLPHLPFYSTVSGRSDAGQLLDAAYWARNMREPVLFSGAVESLVSDGHRLFVELSPHPILTFAVRQVLSHLQQEGHALPSLRRDEDERHVALGSLGSLYASGYALDWDALHPTGGVCVPLPSYPWQRERCWLDIEETPGVASLFNLRSDDAARPFAHPLLGRQLHLAQPPGAQLCEVELDPRRIPYLADHRVDGVMVLPGTVYVEMALAVAAEIFGREECVLRDVEFHQALFLTGDAPATMQIMLAPAGEKEVSFHIYHATGSNVQTPSWTLHASGKIRADVAPADAHSLSVQVPAKRLKDGSAEELSVEDYYRRLSARGYTYGASFQGIKQLWQGHGEASGRVMLSEGVEVESYRFHPALLDACWQVLGAASGKTEDDGVYLPRRIEEIRLYGRPGREVWSHASVDVVAAEENGAELKGNIGVQDEDGRTLLEILGLRCLRIDPAARRETQGNEDEWFYQLQWRPAARDERSDDAASETHVGANWIIFADAKGFGLALSQLLSARGDSCVMVERGTAYEKLAEDRFRIRPACAEDLRRLLIEVEQLTPATAQRGIVHLWSIDAPTLADDATGVELEAAQVCGAFSVLSLVKALGELGGTKVPRVWLVTQGAQPVGDKAACDGLSQSPVWGLGRTIALEHPELRCTRVDLDPSLESTTAEPRLREMAGQLFDQLFSTQNEDQIAFRAGHKFVLRLAHVSPEDGAQGTAHDTSDGSDATPRRLAVPRAEAFCLNVSPPSSLENLRLRPSKRRRSLAADEVEIEVHAAGLNFRDVMKVLGVYPGVNSDAVQLGDECAGKIVAVGAGVAGFGVGDEVVAIARECFGPYATTKARFLARKPSFLSFEEAATIPVAFSTAFYALCHLGRLGAGERVLIHAAAGGVGLAAVQLAQSCGAEVFATAGSAEKRAFLESLGVRHVFDSRTTEFAGEIMQLTGGEGVDLVLNSLAGEALAKSLSILKPFGRFLEIGKTDIYQNSALGLQLFKHNISFMSIDMDGLFQSRPLLGQSILAEVMQQLRQGTLSPLPCKVFQLEDATDAFRFMAQRKNIGKVVLSLREIDERRASATVAAGTDAALIRPDKTYLITGGLSGLGLAVAGWMIEEGARHLMLVGRQDAGSEAAVRIAELRATSGATIETARVDVAETVEVARLLAQIERTMPALDGIVHAAGLLDDGILLQQDEERFARIMRPKVQGAWNLHRLTSNSQLGFFVLFSSAASMLGSPGQGTYAAANAFLDALAHRRRARGLSALSINWGAWSEIGLAARPDRGGRLASQGIESLSPETGLRVLGRLLQTQARPLSQVGVLPFNWREWNRSYPGGCALPLLCELAEVNAGGGGATRAGAPKRPGQPDREALLSGTPAERVLFLEEYLRKLLGTIIGHAASKLDAQQSINSLGLDSLMAIELKNKIENDLGVGIPVVNFLKGYSLSQLAAQLDEMLAGNNSSLSATSSAPALEGGGSLQPEEFIESAGPENVQAAIEQLSDEEVNAMLSEMLAEQEATG